MKNIQNPFEIKNILPKMIPEIPTRRPIRRSKTENDELIKNEQPIIPSTRPVKRCTTELINDLVENTNEELNDLEKLISHKPFSHPKKGTSDLEQTPNIQPATPEVPQRPSRKGTLKNIEQKQPIIPKRPIRTENTEHFINSDDSIKTDILSASISGENLKLELESEDLKSQTQTDEFVETDSNSESLEKAGETTKQETEEQIEEDKDKEKGLEDADETKPCKTTDIQIENYKQRQDNNEKEFEFEIKNDKKRTNEANNYNEEIIKDSSSSSDVLDDSESKTIEMNKMEKTPENLKELSSRLGSNAASNESHLVEVANKADTNEALTKVETDEKPENIEASESENETMKDEAAANQTQPSKIVNDLNATVERDGELLYDGDKETVRDFKKDLLPEVFANRPQKKAPPPIPKKPSSKIAAFHEMLQKQQAQNVQNLMMTSDSSNGTDASVSVDVDEKKDKKTKSSLPVTQNNTKQQQFVKNLNNLFALPGMVSPGTVLPNSLNRNSNDNKNVDDNYDTENEANGRTDITKPETKTDIRKKRARGPRGRKLPSQVSQVTKIVDTNNLNTVHIFHSWSIQFGSEIKEKTDIEPNVAECNGINYDKDNTDSVKESIENLTANALKAPVEELFEKPAEESNEEPTSENFEEVMPVNEGTPEKLIQISTCTSTSSVNEETASEEKGDKQEIIDLLYTDDNDLSEGKN